jgi:archaellin
MDVQNIIALVLVAVAAAYVLQCMASACGFRKSTTQATTCGNCNGCASGKPAVVEIQLLKNDQPTIRG